MFEHHASSINLIDASIKESENIQKGTSDMEDEIVQETPVAC